MSYKVYLPGGLNAVEWSQAVWKGEGRTVNVDDCKQEMIHPFMLQHLPRRGLIVDAGAGICKWPIYLRRLGYSVMGIEVSYEGCTIARENDPGLDMVRADVRQTPLKPRCVDAVLSLGVVEHDEDGPLDALREAHRILKPNGLLILTVPYNNLFRRALVNSLGTLVAWRRQRAGMSLAFAEYRFTKRELRGFLARSGFEVIATYPNDALPPLTVGLWVDYCNLRVDPRKAPATLFKLDGFKRKVALALLRWFPWLVCGEIAFVARSK